MIRSKALQHDAIEGNELFYSERVEKDGQIILKDCTLVRAKDDEMIAGDKCVVKHQTFTFSGRPARSFGKGYCLGEIYSLGREETVMALLPERGGEYSNRTTGTCSNAWY